MQSLCTESRRDSESPAGFWTVCAGWTLLRNWLNIQFEYLSHISVLLKITDLKL